ncbi:MAG: twin-arginine translocation signal domain-containing protein, partial [Woeseia sp.]|nr:twin-arginine translocation signal domain-containing protein [Woeseia sp.]
MADDKISRREFINKSSAAAGTVAVGAVAGSAHAHDAADYAQSDYSVRTKALISVLSKKGLVNQASMDAVVDFYENKVGPHIGARVIARSWVDADYRERLLADARAVAREDDLTGVQGTDL